MTKLKRAGALSMLVASAIAAPPADNLPKPFTFARYQGMAEKSPFAIATAAAPPPTAASFAKDLYVANAARSPDGDLVTVASTADKNFKKYLTTKAPVDGFSISNIEWSDKVGATKVTVSKDGQFATLAFNQALLTQPIASAQAPQPQVNSQQIAPPPPGQQQGLQPAPVPMLPQNAFPGAPAKPMQVPMPVPTVPTLPTPPSRVRGMIQRSPGPNAATPAPAATPQPEL
ncbi:MAG: hypothetical protein M3Z64_11465 [Verrucomicrobiota bacterium]|nr:hypothetical protein [Verrucomicrobiota bacterium]